MAEQYISSRNLQFVLHEMLKIENLNRFERFQDYDKDSINLALEAAKSISDSLLFPYYMEMDKKKAYYKDGVVHTHPILREVMQTLGEGGWIGGADDYDFNGQQMPATLYNAGFLTMYAANANAAAHGTLTTGAANLIRSFANKELNDYYIPKLYSGQWQGTMALTEPQAGSSLTDITSSASPTGKPGEYKIKGQKIYISSGDHQGVDNVVHLTLAKVDGAPLGTKGISLFVVPKYREENGEFVSNDVTTAGIYGKMGQKGYVAAHLMYGESDDCYGYLVGNEHSGLSYMFQMMNEARIGTGMMATGSASAAYYASLKYAHERPQGRHLSNKDPKLPQVPIIEHADVKRMLMYQKAVVEGSVALTMLCSHYHDIATNAEGEEAKNAHIKLELLTPICKSFPAEWAIQSVSNGMQVLGGAGYCDDFPLEQLYRDVRINAIYEGTTAIHGLDLLGRKVMMENGQALQVLLAEVQADMAAAQDFEALKPYSDALAKNLNGLGEVTMKLMKLAMNDKPEVFTSEATTYLEYFATMIVGWLWIKQAVVAAKALEGASGDEQTFYQSKIKTMEFYFEYEMVKTSGMRKRLLSDNRLTLDMSQDLLV